MGQDKPAVLADAFFHARAYIDRNGNGVVDEDDPPLMGAYFNAAGSDGIDGGGSTNSNGFATAWFPVGGVRYPVALRMQPLADSPYVLVGRLQAVLQEGESAVPDFLFAVVVTPTLALP